MIKDLCNIRDSLVEPASSLTAIQRARDRAFKEQQKQATAMLKNNKKQINSLNVGDKVLLRTDGVNRGAADP